MSKPDIASAIRSMALDKDNMPRMDSEQWLPIGVGLAAAEEIERLRAAAALALHEMRHTVAPRDSFTDAVDALDAALNPKAD